MLITAITLISIVSIAFSASLFVTFKKPKKKIRVNEPIEDTIKKLQEDYDEEIVAEIKKDVFQNRYK